MITSSQIVTTVVFAKKYTIQSIISEFFVVTEPDQEINMQVWQYKVWLESLPRETDIAVEHMGACSSAERSRLRFDLCWFACLSKKKMDK